MEELFNNLIKSPIIKNIINKRRRTINNLISLCIIKIKDDTKVAYV